MHDSEFMPWYKLSNERLAKELVAQNEFVPAKYTHYPLLLNTKNQKRKCTLRTKVIQPKKFIPGKVFYPFDVDSCLTKREQAICLNVLKLHQLGRNLNHLSLSQQQDLELYKSLQGQIQEEHRKFLDYVKNDWQKTKSRLDVVKNTIHRYAHQMWEKKLRTSLSYPQFFNPYSNVCLTCNNPKSVQVAIQETILSYGSPPVFTCPTLTSKYILKCLNLHPSDSQYTYNSKLPVSQDCNVTRILENNNIDVVISMSGIKRLMDDTTTINDWCIPFSVKLCKQVMSNGNYIMKNIVFIDKPLPKQSPTYVDVNEYGHKHLVQLNLCMKTTGRGENLEEAILNPYYCAPSNSKSKQGNVNSGELSNSSLDQPKNLCQVNYSIWDMKKTSDENVLLKSRMKDKDIRFLLRQKIAAYEVLPDGNKRPLVLTPKLEYQVEYGANISTKHELISQWTDLFFRPFSHMYRIRILGRTSEVIYVESVALEQINTEALYHHQYRPHERLSALFTIFSKLTTLECGNYLMRHNSQTGAFAEILKEALNLKANARFDLHHEYNVNNYKVRSAQDRPWCPIDVNFILDVHSTYKRMPGMFKPLIKRPKIKIGKKKKNKQKKKAKARQKKGDK